MVGHTLWLGLDPKTISTIHHITFHTPTLILMRLSRYIFHGQPQTVQSGAKQAHVRLIQVYLVDKCG